MLTPAGCFELRPTGWLAVWLTADGEELIAGAPGFGIETTGNEPVVTEPDAAALAAVEQVDPYGVRLIEFSAGADAAARYQAAAAREASAARLNRGS